MTNHDDRRSEAGGSAPGEGATDDVLDGGDFTEQMSDGEGQADGISGATHGGRVAEE
jgi:hypothetical protein